MNIWDYLILAVIAGAVIFAFRRMKKKKAAGCSGCCEGCSGCSADCSGSTRPTVKK